MLTVDHHQRCIRERVRRYLTYHLSYGVLHVEQGCALESTRGSSDAVDFSGPGKPLLRFCTFEGHLLVWEASHTNNEKVYRWDGKENMNWCRKRLVSKSNVGTCEHCISI